MRCLVFCSILILHIPVLTHTSEIQLARQPDPIAQICGFLGRFIPFNSTLFQRLGPGRVGGNQSRSKDLSSDFNSSTASHNRTDRKVRADKNAVPRETHDKRSRPLPPIIQESTVEDQVEISASRVTVMLGQFSKDTRHNDHTSNFKHATGTPTSKTEITAPSNTFLTLAAFSWNGRNKKDLVPTKAAHRNPKRKQPAHKHFREHVHTDHNAQGSQKKETKVRRTKGKLKVPSIIEAFLRQASRHKVPLRLDKEKIILTRARTAQDVPDPSTKSGNAFRSSNSQSENSTSRLTDEPVYTSASKTFERVVAGVTTPQTVIVPKHTNASAKSTNKSHYSILLRQHGAGPFTTVRKNAPIVSTNKTSEVNDQNDQTVPLTFVVVPAQTPNIQSAIVSNVAKWRLKSRRASTSQELKTETQQRSSKSERNVRNGILNKVLNRPADSALKDRNVHRPESLSSTTAQSTRKQIPPRRQKRDLANAYADLDVEVDDVIDDFIGAHPRVSLRDKRTAIMDSDISELMGRKAVLQRIARDNSVNPVKPDLSGSPGYHPASPSKTGPTSESATTFKTKESPLTDRETNINLVVNAEKSALGYGGVDFHVESIFDEGGQEQQQQHRGEYLRQRKASDILGYLGNPEQRGIRPMSDVGVERSRRHIRDSDEGSLVDSDNGDVEHIADEGNNDEGSEEEDDDGEGQDDNDTGDDGQEELFDDQVRRRKASDIKQLLDGLERGTLRFTGQMERRYKREIDEGDHELDSDAVEGNEDEGIKDPAIVDDDEEEEEGHGDEGHDDNDDNDEEDGGQDDRKRRRKALDIMQYLGALKQRTPRFMTGGGVQRKRRHRRENDDSDSNDNGKGNDKDHGDEGEGNKEKDRENKKRDKGDDNGNQEDEKNNDESLDEDSHEDNGLEDAGATAIPLAEKKVSEGDSMLKLDRRNSLREKTHRLKDNPLSQRPATVTDRKSNGSSPPRTEGEKEMDFSGNTFETEQKSDPFKEPTSHGEGSSDAEERNQGHPSTPEHVAKEDLNPKNKNINMSITEIRHVLHGLLQNETKDFVPNPSSRETGHHLRKKRKVLGKHRYPAQSVEQRLALETFRMEPEEIEMDIVEPTRPDHGDALFDRIIQDTQIRPDELRMDEKVPDAIGEAKKWKRRRRRNAKNEKTAGPELAAVVKDTAKDSLSEHVHPRVRRSVTAGLNDVLTDSRPQRFSHVPRHNEKARERSQRSVFDADPLVDDDDINKIKDQGEENKDDEVAEVADEGDEENGGDNTNYDGDSKGVEIFEDMILDSALDEAEDIDGKLTADDDEPCDDDSDDDCEHAKKKHKSDGDAKRKKRSDWMKLIDNGDGDVDYEDDEKEDEPCDDDSDDCENDEQSEESDDDNGEDETDDNAEEGDEPCDSSSGDDCESADQIQDLDTFWRRRKRSSEQNQDLDTNFRKTKRQSVQNQDLDTDLRRKKQLEQNQDLDTDLKRRKRSSEQNQDLDTNFRQTKRQSVQNQDLDTDLRSKRQSDQNQDLDTDLRRRKRSSEQNQDLNTVLRRRKRQSEQNQDLNTVLRRRKRHSDQNQDLDTNLRKTKRQSEQNEDLNTDWRRKRQSEQNQDIDTDLRKKKQWEQNQDLDTVLRRRKRQSEQNQDLDTVLRRRKRQSEQNQDLDTDLRRKKQLEQNLDLDTVLRKTKRQSEQNQDRNTDLRRKRQSELNQDLDADLRMRKRQSDQNQDLDTDLRRKKQSEQNQGLDTDLRKKKQLEQNQDLDTVLRRRKRQSEQNQDLDTVLRKKKQLEQNQDLDTVLRRRKRQSEQNQDLDTVLRRRKRQSEQNQDLDTVLRRRKRHSDQNQDLDTNLRKTKRQSEQNEDLNTDWRRKRQSEQNQDIDTDLRKKKQWEQNQDLDTVLRRRKRQSEQNQDLDTVLRRRKRQSEQNQDLDTVLRRRKRQSEQNQDLDTVLRRKKRQSEQNQDLDTVLRRRKRQSEQNQDLDTVLRRRKRQSEQNQDLDTDLRKKKQLEQNQDLDTVLRRRKRQSEQNQDLDTVLRRRKRQSEQNQDLDTDLRKKKQFEQNQDLDTVLRRRKRQSEQNQDLDTVLRRKKRQWEQNQDLDTVLRRRKRQSKQNQDLDTVLRRRKRQSEQNQDLDTDLRKKKQLEQNQDLDTDLRRKKQSEQNQDLDTDLRRKRQSKQNQDLDTVLRRRKRQSEQNQDLDTDLRRKRQSKQNQDLDTDLRRRKRQSDELTEADNDDDIDSIYDDGDDENDGQPCDETDDDCDTAEQGQGWDSDLRRRRKKRSAETKEEDDDDCDDSGGGGGGDDYNDRDDDDIDERGDDDDKDSDGDDNSTDSDNSRGSDTQPANKPHGKSLEITPTPRQLAQIDKAASQIMKTVFFEAVDDLLSEDDCPDLEQDDKDNKEYYESIFSDYTSPSSSKDDAGDPYGGDDFDFDDIFTSSRITRLKEEPPPYHQNRQNRPAGNGSAQLVGKDGAMYLQTGEKISKKIPGYIDDRNYAGAENIGIETAASVISRLLMEEHLDNAFFELD